MNIYHVRRRLPPAMVKGYLEHIVIAPDEATARRWRPGGTEMLLPREWADPLTAWVREPADLDVILIGTAPPGAQPRSLCPVFLE